MYSIDPKINKEFVLSKVSEESIFNHYLCPVQFGDKVTNPMRQDKNPTCSFYHDRAGRLIFRDHSGFFHGDCFEAVRRIFNVTFSEALLIIVRDFNLMDPKYIPQQIVNKRSLSAEELKKIKTEIKVKRRSWNTADVVFWKSFSLNSTILKKYRVDPVEVAWVNGEIKYRYNPNDPCYVYYFLDGDYKLYFPLRKEHRFICNTSKLQGYDQLPATGELVVISKSCKDVMVFDLFSIPATAPQAESISLTDEQYKDLSQRFKLVVSNYDFDRAGCRTAFKMQSLYGIRPLFLTNGRFGTPDYGAKDISDYIKKFGLDKTLELIKDVYNEIVT